MPIKTFHLPEHDGIATEDRRRKKALIGGSLDKRREHGKPGIFKGQLILDPIYHPEQEAQLRQACAVDVLRPLTIEVGFQMGEFAAAWCALHPDRRYVGFEVRKSYCEEASAKLEAAGVDNALVCLVDAREMIPRVLEPGTLDELLVFFPDPWWKPRHIKKRLISPEFIADAALWLRPGGRLLFKSDVEDYASWAEGLMRSDGHFEVRALEDPSDGLPLTLRERRCRHHGLPTWAVEARRSGGPA